MDETKVFSVSELNGLIKELFDHTPLFLNNSFHYASQISIEVINTIISSSFYLKHC